MGLTIRLSRCCRFHGILSKVSQQNVRIVIKQEKTESPSWSSNWKNDLQSSAQPISFQSWKLVIDDFRVCSPHSRIWDRSQTLWSLQDVWLNTKDERFGLVYFIEHVPPFPHKILEIDGLASDQIQLQPTRTCHWQWEIPCERVLEWENHLQMLDFPSPCLTNRG